MTKNDMKKRISEIAAKVAAGNAEPSEILEMAALSSEYAKTDAATVLYQKDAEKRTAAWREKYDAVKSEAVSISEDYAERIKNLRAERDAALKVVTDRLDEVKRDALKDGVTIIKRGRKAKSSK